MKLLLTSAGLYNDSIKNALVSMMDKSFDSSKITIITTAANGVDGDKRWLIDMENKVEQAGFKEVAIIDFAGLPKELWLPRMESADVLFFTGGNSAHLMFEAKKAGLMEELPRLLENRVYVGNSAGSIAASANLSLSNPTHKTYSKERILDLDNQAMGLVDFLLRPHFNRPGHPSTEADVQKMMAEYNVAERVYLIDDNTAIKVVDGEVEVISEGEYKIFNE